MRVKSHKDATHLRCRMVHMVVVGAAAAGLAGCEGQGG